MLFLDDPEEMTPEGRVAEIAAILAAGYMRLRQPTGEPASDLDSPASTDNPLDCSGERLPLCDEGLTDGEATLMEVTP